MKLYKRVLVAALSLAFVFSCMFVPAASADNAYDTSRDNLAGDVFGGWEEPPKSAAIYDFEDGETDVLEPNANADTAAPKFGFETVKNPDKDAINDSENVLHISPVKTAEAAEAKNQMIYVASQQALPKGSTIYSVNFDFYLAYKTTSNYIFPTFVYDYVDENNWKGVTFRSLGTGKLQAQLVGRKSGVTTSWEKYTFNNEFIANAFHYINHTDDYTSLLTESQWLSVSAEYSEYDVEITVKNKEGLMVLRTHTLALFNGSDTRCGFTSMNACYFDNININVENGVDDVAADAYKIRNTKLFRLRVPTLSSDDKAALEKAVSEYEALPAGAQMCIPLYRDYLAALENRMAEIAGVPDYSIADGIITDSFWKTQDTFVWEDNFDDTSALVRYIDLVGRNKMEFGPSPQIVADTKFGSSALMLHNTSLTLKTELLPKKAQILSMEYDFYLDAEKLNDIITLYVYRYNADSWAYIKFTNPKGSTETIPTRYQMYNCFEGAEKANDYAVNKSVNLFEPVHVQYFFADNNFELLITQNGETVIEDTWTIKDIRGIPMLGSLSDEYLQYYDNLKVTFKQGDWDEDEIIDTIHVNYSGNTHQAPGDVVTISGESLGRLVSGVEIMPIQNRKPANTDRKYLDYAGFDSSGTAAGAYSSAPQAYPWDTENAVSAKVEQTTEDSIKFILPGKNARGEPMPQGLFAVKLYGQDSKTNYIEKIIYINQPRIDYVVGNDGDHASPGGYYEIVGKNIAFPQSQTDYSNLLVLLTDERGSVVAELPVEEVYSDYNMRVAVPETVAAGAYELWVYNGYGDNYGWGIPLKVKVGADRRDQLLSGTMINVLDNSYIGQQIRGDKNQNVTYLVQKLLDILYQQGGGVLYFPKGIYRFTQPIVVPENVTIQGTGIAETVFLWTSFNWEYKKLPSYLIAATSNVVIDGISIYAHRTAGVVSIAGDQNENVYLSNIRTYFSSNAGAATGGAHSGSSYTAAELEILLATENTGWCISTESEAQLTNLQIKNCEFAKYKANMRGFRLTYSNAASGYYQLCNVKASAGWSPIQANYVIARNVNHSGATFAITGEGVLYDRCYVHDNTINNRELVVFDLAPSYSNIRIYKDVSDPSGCSYLFGTTKNLNVDSLIHMQLYVASGRGNGQTRIIRSCEQIAGTVYKITFDTPFQIMPNRNSSCVIRRAREHIYFVENKFYNGSTVGSYGGAADLIFDGNVYERVGQQYLWALKEDMIWYVTYNNEVTVYDPFYNHSDGVEDDSGFTYMLLRNQMGSKYMRGITFRNCDMAGRYLMLDSRIANSIVDVVLDKTRFSKSEYAVTHTTTAAQTGLDGILLYANSYSQVDAPFSSGTASLQQLSNAKNSVYDKRVVILDDVEIDYPIGDINMDGGVDLKDCTLLRYYLVGMLELNAKQLALADADQNKKVDLKDCTAIRQLCLKN